ncbi:hypothetical protein HMPREF9406_4042 [Clostridium sp. HGF2]|nr:hypothetical protein HMPREF9406_4042 [Clostridium sp. HGF2]
MPVPYCSHFLISTHKYLCVSISIYHVYKVQIFALPVQRQASA